MTGYAIMMAMVVGAACIDICTGLIAARLANDVHSGVLRRGGLRKVAEILIMIGAIIIELGLRYLSQNISMDGFVDVSAFSTRLVFGYIIFMEIVSMLENYAKINPAATGWINRIVYTLRDVNEEDDNEHKKP